MTNIDSALPLTNQHLIDRIVVRHQSQIGDLRTPVSVQSEPSEREVGRINQKDDEALFNPTGLSVEAHAAFRERLASWCHADSPELLSGEDILITLTVTLAFANAGLIEMPTDEVARLQQHVESLSAYH